MPDKKKVIIINTDKATLYEMFDYFCSKIDFGRTFLDAEAVGCINRLYMELGKDKKTYKV